MTPAAAGRDERPVRGGRDRLRARLPVSLVCSAVVSLGAVADATAATSVPCGQVAGPNGLIAAITQANAASTPSTINLAKCAYELTGVAATSASTGPHGLPVITGAITLNGNGATIRRSPSAPHLRIARVAPGALLKLNFVTLSGGLSDTLGGAIWNDGTLELNASRVLDNVSHGGGGGIGSRPGSVLTIVDSTVSGNATPGANQGGGIASGGALTIRRSTISQNSTDGAGGGVESFGTLDVTSTLFAGNTAPLAGAVLGQSTATLTDSVFTGNAATLDGGALYLQPGTSADVRRAVMVGNRAGRSGGAIFAAPTARLGLGLSVISANLAAQGGGIFAAGATVAAAGSVIVGNRAGNCAPTGSVPACSG